jgi:hypothetical protein
MKARLGRGSVWMGRMLLAVAVVAALAPGTAQPVAAQTQIDIAGPPGSGRYRDAVQARARRCPSGFPGGRPEERAMSQEVVNRALFPDSGDSDPAVETTPRVRACERRDR